MASIARTQRTRGRARGLRLCGLALPPSSRLLVGQVQEASQTQHPWLSVACCLSSKTKVMGPRLNFPLLHLLISPPLPSSSGLPDQGTNSYQLPGQHLPRCQGASPLPTQVPHTFLHTHSSAINHWFTLSVKSVTAVCQALVNAPHPAACLPEIVSTHIVQRMKCSRVESK